MRNPVPDQEDLAAYRVAELRATGIAARVRYATKAGRLYVRVQWPDGRIEDPTHDYAPLRLRR